jgi:hypothetical protein
MENHNLVQFLNTCLSDGCVAPFGFSKYETQVYLAFCIFNVGRLFTYFPTIAKLRATGCTGDGQSVWTWLWWILANSTLSYYAYIASKYQVSDFVWINIINTFMCLVCVLYIIKVQKRAGTLSWIPFRKVKKNYRVSVNLSDDLYRSVQTIIDKTDMPINGLIELAVGNFLSTKTHEEILNRKPNQAFNLISYKQKNTSNLGEY